VNIHEIGSKIIRKPCDGAAAAFISEWGGSTVMSRAFVKEADENPTAGDIPERPLPAHTNYVTPHGREQLELRMHELQQQREQSKAAADSEALAKQKLAEVERDMRYYSAQIKRAIVVDPAAQSRDAVYFGATVRIRSEDDTEHEFSIVGDDEADVGAGKISWASPLAKAMIGAHLGDTVVWKRPAADTDVRIVAIHYPDA
jgi:transcription elongation GreA/GreB family factor